MKHSFRYNLVDVFTDRALTGNSLAVFTQAKDLSAPMMQSVAREMNLSETVFFLPPEQGGHVKVRIFTPHKELPFAGHPILGSAWILGQPIEVPTLRLETGIGVIQVDLYREGGLLDLARMTQPLPSFVPATLGPELFQALGCVGEVDRTLPIVEAQNGPSHLLVELSSRELLDGLVPDFSRLATLTNAGIYMFVQDGCECFTRYFAPASGINEDPATGSAGGPLAAYLVKNGRLKSEESLTIHQGQVMLRPSTMFAEAKVEGGELLRVTVAGRAVVVARGEMLL